MPPGLPLFSGQARREGNRNSAPDSAETRQLCQQVRRGWSARRKTVFLFRACLLLNQGTLRCLVSPKQAECSPLMGRLRRAKIARAKRNGKAGTAHSIDCLQIVRRELPGRLICHSFIRRDPGRSRSSRRTHLAIPRYSLWQTSLIA